MSSRNNEVFFTPDYLPKFKCIGKDCIDSCCVGWNVEIDKKTYKKYKNSSNRTISSISKQYLFKKENDSNIAYAKIENKIDNTCPFLTNNKLCKAYNLLGKDSLSIGCSTYPRIIKNFKQIGFISGELSCPEIARLCLGDKNLRVKKLTKNKLKNIFNSNNIHSFEISKDLPEAIMKFIEEVIYKLSNNDTFFNNLDGIIRSFYKLNNTEKNIEIFSKSEKKQLEENNLLIQINFLSKICFSNLTGSSRYHQICKRAAEKSNFFSQSKTEFQRNYIYNYRNGFTKFKRENNFIYKNFFINEFLKNIEKFKILTNEFDNFVREILCLLNLTNFLVICQLFESEKEFTVNDYIEVISAVLKTIQSSREKTETIINFFRKIDNNSLSKRLLDIY